MIVEDCQRIVEDRGLETPGRDHRSPGALAARVRSRQSSGQEAAMRSVKVKVVRLPHAMGLPLPAYQSTNAAGLDLMAAVPADAPVTLAPGGRAQIPTGIAIALPNMTEGQVRPRSGLAARHGLSVLNTPGTIDADYRGEILVILVNFGSESFVVERGQRIAQLVISPVLHAQLSEQKKLNQTKRGAKGFGSTGEGTIDKKRKRRP
jgi:dUTP pyrophosphatase